MAGPKKRRCIRGTCSTRGRNGVKKTRKRVFFHTKFSDVYLSCSEDGPLHTGCDMNFNSGKHQKGIKPPRVHSKPEAVDFRGVYHLEAPQLVFKPGNTVLPATESNSNIHVEQETDFQTPMEIIGKEATAFPLNLMEMNEPFQKSPTTAESQWPSPMEIEPPHSVGFLENSVTAALLPDWDSDMYAQKMKDSVESPDHMERLARKYMQQCVVESSTESESESGADVVPSPLSARLKKSRDSRGRQFLDPYDGDSEDASIHSDCSLTSLNSIKVAPCANSGTKAVALEDADTSEDRDSLPETPDRLCPETKVSGVQRVNDCEAPLELPSQERDFPKSLLQSSELTRATEAFTSMWETPDHSLLLSVNPSASADLLACPGGRAPQPTAAADCDGTSAKLPLIKRKRGLSVPEGVSEKLRKKFCAT